MLTASRSIALLLCAGSLLLSGCAFQAPGAATGASQASLSGVIHGGPNPIKGATIKLYSTNTGSSSDYGSAGTLLASTTTDSTGSFGFDNVSNPYTCPQGEYAYITSTGGNTGANTANNNAVLMAAIGSCSNLSSVASQSATRIYLSEASTVAAAYALGNFMTVTDNGDGLQTVNVGAPSSANATTPKCTGTGSAMSCTTASLAHAFANAYNLVDSVNFNSTMPTGNARTVLPGNSQASVPAGLINMIANIGQACINSMGGAATDTSTNCGKLFSYTTRNSVAPTDTLQAFMNMAKQPTTNVTSLIAVASPNSFFQPSVATTVDFSVAIVYKGTSSGTFVYPFSLALDAADNVYISLADSSSQTTSALAGMTATGDSIFFTTPSTTYPLAKTMATDTLGHVFVSNEVSSATTGGVVSYSTTDGSFVQLLNSGVGYMWGTAVDRSNNVWFSRASTSGTTNVGEFTVDTSGSTPAYTLATLSGTPKVSYTYPFGIAVDANQNIWGVTSSTGYAFVVPNSGSSASPAYANALLTQALPTTSGGYGVAFNSAGKAFFAMASGGATVTPTLSGSTVTSIATTGSFSSAASAAQYGQVDGDGTYWYPGYTSGGYLYFLLAGGTSSTSIRPCYAPAGATTCTSTAAGYARYMQADSTGSLWVDAGTNGNVLQIIGTAAPTWPQMSFGHPGERPYNYFPAI